MTWKITVSHVDEKTGECISNQAILTDESVENSNLDLLDLTFEKITDELNLRINEKNCDDKITSKKQNE